MTSASSIASEKNEARSHLFYETSHSPSLAELVGYEQAKQMIDFCFIANPYYPTESMMQNLQGVAVHLSNGVAEMGPYHLISEGRDLPVFAFALRPEVKNYSVYDVSDALRKRGWQVPAYSLCANLENTSVLRVVVRNGFSRDLADLLVDDLKREVSLLKHTAATQPHHERQRFHH